MASSNKARPEVEQIDLTKLNLQQLQQLKTEFESVCTILVLCVRRHMTKFLLPNMVTPTPWIEHAFIAFI